MKAMRKSGLQRIRVKFNLHKKRSYNCTGCACKMQLSVWVDRGEKARCLFSPERTVKPRGETQGSFILISNTKICEEKSRWEIWWRQMHVGTEGEKHLTRERERKARVRHNEVDKAKDRASKKKRESWSKGEFFLFWWINCTEKSPMGDNGTVSQRALNWKGPKPQRHYPININLIPFLFSWSLR